MGFLFILMFVMLVLMEANRFKASVNTPPEPACPPHRWRYHEIKDREGNTLKHTIACELCGPLKPIE